LLSADDVTRFHAFRQKNGRIKEGKCVLLSVGSTGDCVQYMRIFQTCRTALAEADITQSRSPAIRSLWTTETAKIRLPGTFITPPPGAALDVGSFRSRRWPSRAERAYKPENRATVMSDKQTRPFDSALGGDYPENQGCRGARIIVRSLDVIGATGKRLEEREHPPICRDTCQATDFLAVAEYEEYGGFGPSVRAASVILGKSTPAGQLPGPAMRRCTSWVLPPRQARLNKKAVNTLPRDIDRRPHCGVQAFWRTGSISALDHHACRGHRADAGQVGFTMVIVVNRRRKVWTVSARSTSPDLMLLASGARTTEEGLRPHAP